MVLAHFPKLSINLKQKSFRLQNLTVRHLAAAAKPLFFLKVSFQKIFRDILPVFLVHASTDKRLRN